MHGLPAGKSRCDIWLWDGSVEYEGSLVRLAEGEFTAHVREAKRKDDGRATGRRLPLPFVELQRRFVARRFLSYFKDCAGQLFEAEIQAVQRSSTSGFDYFVCGRFRMTDERRAEMFRARAEETSTPQARIWL